MNSVNASRSDKEREIDSNLDFFLTQLPDLMIEHRGQYALLRKKEVVGIYDTIRDAQMTGERFYADGLFSVQKIEDKPENLGYYSYAMHLAVA